MPRGKRSALEPPPPRRRDNRRERGSGTVYFDARRVRWVGVVTVNGKRRKVVAKTKTDASAALSKIVAARVTGAPVDDRAHTVAQAVATFLERELPARTSHNRPLAPSTIERERWAADLIGAEIGKCKLATLTVENVEAMLDNLAARPMSVASLRKVRSATSHRLGDPPSQGEPQCRTRRPDHALRCRCTAAIGAVSRRGPNAAGGAQRRA